MTKFFSFFKKSIIIIFIIIFLLELVSFILLKFDHTELFAIRNYTEKTNDKRIFTLKKSYSVNELDHIYKGETFLIITSNERLRISKKDNKISNYINSNNIENKFLFLGDSVPFGYGVDAEDSIPFYFKKYNKDLTVLNGAIPSYSLAQSIERYEKEFQSIKNIKYIYLQIYSPAPEYALLGIDWDVNDNWANFSEQVLRPYHLVNIDIPIYGDSFFLDFLRKKIVRIAHKKKKTGSMETKVFNKDSEEKFVNHINSNLNKLHSLIKNKETQLILASTNVPEFSKDSRTESLENAINLLNKTFYNFSLKNEKVHYFDMGSELNVDSENMFIDFCCHLSGNGASLMAFELTKLMKNE